jgi:hypothetical protein
MDYKPDKPQHTLKKSLSFLKKNTGIEKKQSSCWKANIVKIT